MMRFKRRSFGSGQRLEQHPEDAPALDLNRDNSENMRELLTEITKKEHISTAKRMGYLNNFSQLVRTVPPSSDFGFTSDEIAACLRVTLINPAKEVRAASFRAFRYFITDEDSVTVFLNQRIDLFIIKSLDLPPSPEAAERVQALKLVRKMVYLCPHLFPMSVAMTLSSISSNTNTSEKDSMSTACLATLCELAIQNTKIGSYSGVINSVINAALDCSVPRMNESLISTILYLLNHPEYRLFVRQKVGLEGVLAPITDLYYTSDIQDNLIRDDHLAKMESSKQALVTILKSWPGLMLFCDPAGKNLESLIGIFELPNDDIRRSIIDSLYDVFCLRRPKDTEDFMEALESVDPSSMQDTWRLTELFLLAEADAVLPHRAKPTRMNVVESYVSLILYAFFQAGILESLVKVIMTSDDSICIRGSILLGELLHMANLLLPPKFSFHSHCLPTLISLATNLEKTPMERGKASASAGYLDQVHQMKKRGVIPNSLFMEQLITQASSDHKRKGRNDKLESQFTWKDMDEVLSAIHKSQVMASPDKDHNQWEWDLITTILTSPKMSLKRPDEPTSYRFVRKLAMFFKPCNKIYPGVKQTHRLGRKYSEVALQLTDFLLQKDEQPEGEQLVLEMLQDISSCLGEAAQPGVLSNIFSTHSLSETLSRDYFLIIGRLSSSQVGLRILDKTPGIFQYLMEICSMSSRDSLIKVVISCFDYGKDGIARILLSKALTSAPLSARLYTTKFLRVLLRIKSPFFSNWGIEFLTNQLYDCDPEIVEATISILEEACEDEANLQRLIEVKPSLLHLGEQGIRLLSRYVSVTHGFSYLEELNYLDPLLKAWENEYNKEYVNWMELEIMEALSSYERICQEGGYMNRSHSINYEKNEVYVLPHLYGELARNRYGIKLIDEQGLLNNAVSVVREARAENYEDFNELKAALWAIGHIGSTVAGINLILAQSRKTHLSQSSDPFQDGNNETINGEYHVGEENDTDFEEKTLMEEDDEGDMEEEEPDVISEIVELAYTCDVLTIRGTCFFVLGLMARTSTGATKLEELGWECVRHKGTDMWPVQHDQQGQTYFMDSDGSDDDDASLVDEADIALIEQLSMEPSSSDRFGGVYLGVEDEDELDAEAPVEVRYTVHRYGQDEKGKGKKREEFDDISTILHHYNQEKEENNRATMKIKHYDFDQQGKRYEKTEGDMISALDRLINTQDYASTSFANLNDGGIYCGEVDSQISFSEHKPPEYMSQSVRECVDFEDFMPFISGKISDLPPISKEEVKIRLPGKEIFDEAGIYLGEEYDDEPPDDSIEANISTINPSPPPPYFMSENNRNFPIENNEPLKPIREEKSQENIDVKQNDLLGVAIVSEITVEVLNEPLKENSLDTENIALETENGPKQNGLSSGNTILSNNSDERYRSVSFTDGAGHKPEPVPTSPRSLSFSGIPSHTKTPTSRTQNHPRSDSDPGVVANSLGSSLSSQDSDVLRNGPNASLVVGKKVNNTGNRRKSRSENENAHSDRDRSSSIMSDNSSQGGGGQKSKSANKRLRGASTLNITMGTSPKSLRNFPSMSESPSPYCRGYSAWQTLRKQRSFRKEMDSSFSCDGSSERRRLNRSLGYRRRMDVRKGSSSVGRIRVPAGTSLSSGGGEFNANDIVATPEVYVGRCLPKNLSSFFHIEPYTYTGSWADNFDDPSEILQSLNESYHHIKDRCLACKCEILIDLEKRKNSANKNSEVHVKRISEEESDNNEEDTSRVNKTAIFREVLILTCKLSSVVGSKNTQQEMLALRGRHPWVFQDLCLYSQVIELLGTFSYRLTIRRFIQFLFDGVDFSLIFDTADQILGRMS